MTDEYKRSSLTKAELTKKEYKGVINYEAILAGQLNRIAISRDISNRQFASSVETFANMCPPEVAEASLKHLEKLGLSRCEYESITTTKMRLYDDLWRFINNELKKVGLIFKTSSYEIGLED